MVVGQLEARRAGSKRVVTVVMSSIRCGLKKQTKKTQCLERYPSNGGETRMPRRRETGRNKESPVSLKFTNIYSATCWAENPLKAIVCKTYCSSTDGACFYCLYVI